MSRKVIGRTKCIPALAALIPVDNLQPAPPTPEQYQHLVEELQMQQLEVESQNRELVAIHQQLEESRNRYLDLYEFAPILYATMNPDGLVLDINVRGVAILGVPHNEIVDHFFCQFVIPDHQSVFLAHLAKARDATSEIVCQLTLRTGTGLVPVQLTTVSSSELGSRVRVLRTAIIDLTEQKRMERALHEKEEELYQARKIEAIGRLAGGVAHDFNNLIAGILGLSDELQASLPADDRRREDLGEIIRAANRAFALTRQLLAFGRRQVINPRLLDLNRTVSGVETMLRRLIGEDIRLTVEYGPTAASVRADEGQLEQIFVNLIVNARDAMPKGGEIFITTARVEVLDKAPLPHVDLRPGEYICLTVRDTGVGMDATTLGHIFEPFFTTKGRDKGTGLGLATVHGITKQNGGAVTVVSRLGEGTTFMVYLPTVAEDAPAERRQAERLPPRGGTETVLVVEDEAIVRRVTTSLLERQGYTVLTARNGAEAMEVYEKHKGDVQLLVSDVIMPGMNGSEVARWMRDRNAQMGVIFISGYSEDIISKRGILEPGIAFVEKSSLHRQLARRVREVLDARDRHWTLRSQRSPSPELSRLN